MHVPCSGMSDDAPQLEQPGGDRAIEDLLRAASPAPASAWVHDTERHLLPARGASRAHRWVPFAATAGGLAAVVFGISLAGGGPLASSGGDAAKAKPGCSISYITRVAPQGEVRRQADGSVQVETVRRPVTRRVVHCP